MPRVIEHLDLKGEYTCVCCLVQKAGTCVQSVVFRPGFQVVVCHTCGESLGQGLLGAQQYRSSEAVDGLLAEIRQRTVTGRLVTSQPAYQWPPRQQRP